MAEDRPQLFDLATLARRRDRAVRLGFAGRGDFLWRRAADSIAERVLDTPREFPDAAILGTGAGAVAAALPPKVGARRLVLVDPSPAMLGAARDARPEAEAVVMESETLPLAEGSLDLAVSCLLMHAIDDPVGHLVQLRRALRPDGLLIACLFGGQTLAGLRSAMATAESEITGGITPRVAPMGELRDLGGLLGRAGLALPVADLETTTAHYRDALALMRDLRLMGETNAMAGRARRPMRRDMLARAARLHAEHNGDGNGGVTARYDIVFLTGWAPGPDQPKPLRPGSAASRLADALGTVELPAGDKTGKAKD